MEKLCPKHVLTLLLLCLISFSTQAFASKSQIRDSIESFEINGLTLKSSFEEFKAIADKDYNCRVNDRADTHYWKCRLKPNGKDKTTLTVGVKRNKIVSIDLTSQSPAKSYSDLRTKLAELNQDLLNKKHLHSSRDLNAHDIFYYKNDESPISPSTALVLKTTLECSTTEPTMFILESKVLTFAGAFDDVRVTLSKHTQKQC